MMSDRRPSKLYKCEITPTYDEAYDPPEFFGNVISYPEATVDEVLAWVRRGVESGTIKGEEVEWCDEHGFAITENAKVCLLSPWGQTLCRRRSQRLAIPVDVGEDR